MYWHILVIYLRSMIFFQLLLYLAHKAVSLFQLRIKLIYFIIVKVCLPVSFSLHNTYSALFIMILFFPPLFVSNFSNKFHFSVCFQELFLRVDLLVLSLCRAKGRFEQLIYYFHFYRMLNLPIAQLITSLVLFFLFAVLFRLFLCFLSFIYIKTDIALYEHIHLPRLSISLKLRGQN